MNAAPCLNQKGNVVKVPGTHNIKHYVITINEIVYQHEGAQGERG